VRNNFTTTTAAALACYIKH